MNTDPVCNMTVTETSEHNTEYAGIIYHFCSEHCLKKFENQPKNYVKSEKLTDPVCGMDVNDASIYHVNQNDQTLYFCSDSCLKKYESSPASYMLKESGDLHSCCKNTNPEILDANTTKVSIDKRTTYICPMHPEVISNQPGSCPKCGMTLEEKTVETNEDTSDSIM